VFSEVSRTFSPDGRPDRTLDERFIAHVQADTNTMQQVFLKVLETP
jgi:hypothetical protein